MMPDLPDGVVRLEISPAGEVGSNARATNVYLLLSGRPALIGAGHPTAAAELIDALAAHGVRPSDIERIVAGSWSPHVLGNCASFPRADLFVTSPDMRRPRAWNAWSDARRAKFVGVADEVFERVDKFDRADLDDWLRVAFPSLTNHLDFIPVRTGHIVRAGGLDLEVVDAPGPHSGHSFLWNAEHGICFCGELEFDGLPEFPESAGDYLVSIQRAMDLNPTWLLPTCGAPTGRAQWMLKSMLRLCGNYMGSLPATLSESRTLLEIVDRDLGHLPEHPAAYVEAVLRHRAFLEELARGHAIQSVGRGLDRRYSS